MTASCATVTYLRSSILGTLSNLNGVYSSLQWLFMFVDEVILVPLEIRLHKKCISLTTHASRKHFYLTFIERPQCVADKLRLASEQSSEPAEESQIQMKCLGGKMSEF